MVKERELPNPSTNEATNSNFIHDTNVGTTSKFTLTMTLLVITLGLVYGYVASNSPNSSPSKAKKEGQTKPKLISSIFQRWKYGFSRKEEILNRNNQRKLHIDLMEKQISNDHIETSKDSFGNYNHQILDKHDIENKNEELILLKTPTGAPLPNVLHQVLTEKELEEKNIKRFIIVGDIHGCLEELQALLFKCDYNVDRDAVMLVGDLVNKGPFSAEVIQFARESDFYVIKGNHEDNALSAYYRQGKYAQECPFSYTEYLTKLSPEDISWLKNLPYTISIPHLGIILVHAGVIPEQNIASINPMLLSRMRNLVAHEKKDNKNSIKDSKTSNTEDSCYDGQVRYEGHIKEVPNSDPWVSKYRGPSHVYFGHDARRGLQKTDFATGLDTGCCYGKKLTAIILSANKEDLIESTITMEEKNEIDEKESRNMQNQLNTNDKKKPPYEIKDRKVEPGFEDNDDVIDFKGGLWRKVVSVPAKRMYKDFDAPKEKKKDKGAKTKDFEFYIKREKENI